MFPRLQTLRLSDNDLSAQPAGQEVPSALPSSWTTPTKPPAFPDLEELVLYPGNACICSLPDGQGGFLDVNPGGWVGECKGVERGAIENLEQTLLLDPLVGGVPLVNFAKAVPAIDSCLTVQGGPGLYTLVAGWVGTAIDVALGPEGHGHLL